MNLKYIGRSICIKHWYELCEADGVTQKRMLKKIKLKMNDEGAVVPLSEKKQ